MSMLTNSKSASELNSMLVKEYNKKDIMLISLKQVEKLKGVFTSNWP